MKKIIYNICITTNNTYNTKRGEGGYLFELDIRSRKPIYEQLMDNIKESIIAEILKADEKLPSVRALSQELTVNPNTIQKAYRELEREGYLYSANRKGYFVAPIEHVDSNEKLNELKKQCQDLIKEAIFFGLTKEQLKEWFEEVEKGEGRSDSSRRRDKEL